MESENRYKSSKIPKVQTAILRRDDHKYQYKLFKCQNNIVAVSSLLTYLFKSPHSCTFLSGFGTTRAQKFLRTSEAWIFYHQYITERWCSLWAHMDLFLILKHRANILALTFWLPLLPQHYAKLGPHTVVRDVSWSNNTCVLSLPGMKRTFSLSLSDERLWNSVMGWKGGQVLPGPIRSPSSSQHGALLAPRLLSLLLCKQKVEMTYPLCSVCHNLGFILVKCPLFYDIMDILDISNLL